MSRTIKKDMSLLMVLMAVLSFVIMPTSVYAQATTCTDAMRCPSCAETKTGASEKIWHIPVQCPVPAQGSPTNPIFDWDSTYGYCEQGAAVRTSPACPITIGTLGATATVNNKMIINICCCPDACDFELGDVLGIELQITTPGVYWAPDCNVPLFAPGVPNCYGGGNTAGSIASMYQLKFSLINKGTAATTHTSACSLTSHADGTNPMRNTDNFKIAYYPTSSTQQPTTPSATGVLRPKVLRTPTPYDGYELRQSDIDGNLCDLWVDIPAMQAYDNEITANTEVKVIAKLLVSKSYANPITEGGVDPGCDNDYNSGTGVGGTLNGLSYARPVGDTGLGVDPPVCQATAVLNQPAVGWLDNSYHPTNAGPGGEQAGWNQLVDPYDGRGAPNAPVAVGGCMWRWPSKFCPDCQSPCSCEKVVGILCCAAAAPVPVSSCIYFPYVLSGVDGWISGIGLSRICDPASGSTPEVKFTLTDCNGVSYCATVTPETQPAFNYCFGTQGFSLDQLVGEDPELNLGWSPAIPADYSGQWVLRVTANFLIDGYQFNAGSIAGQYFGAGILPRQSCPCTPTCSSSN